MSAPWLTQLAPDRAPPAAGWWPPAQGWWAVALLALVLAALVVAIVRWWREPRRRFARAALRELRAIRASRTEGAAAARAIENLLRRHAVALHGPERVARLSGERWLEFARAAGGEALAGEAGRSLLAAAFGGGPGPSAAGLDSNAEREQWLAAAAQLIRRSGRAGRPATLTATATTTATAANATAATATATSTATEAEGRQ